MDTLSIVQSAEDSTAPRVEGLAPGAWRSASYLKEMVRDGAVLRVAPHGEGFILEAPSGAELARASRTSELALLLDGLAGKKRPKGRVILAIGKLAPRLAAVRFVGESLNAMTVKALTAEVERREREFTAELATLDAGEA